MKKDKIFIGLTEVSGYYRNLADGLRKEGYPVTFVTSQVHMFNYGGTSAKGIVRLHQFCKDKRREIPKRKIAQKMFWILMDNVVLKMLFLWAVLTHDIFIFGFGTSFDEQARDLFLLNLLGKKVISNIGHGAEARPTYFDGGLLMNDGGHLPPGEIYKTDARKIQKLRRIERYSAYVLCTPLAGHFLTKPFVIANIIGMPINRIEKKPFQGDGTPGVVRILHAPSNPHAKGTFEIRDVISMLKKDGYAIEYVEIQGRPHAEVLDELEKCDFVLDQLFSDTPLAGLGAEAAFFSKPTIMGGYLWKEFKQTVPAAYIAPGVLCEPDGAYEAAKLLIDNKELRMELGGKAKAYLEKNWTSEVVAGAYSSMINNTLPKQWYFDPNHTTNVYGAGMRKELARKIIAEVVDAYGTKGLHLSDKPQLEKRFIDFINDKTG